jgi:hypothetical protein
MATSSGWMTRSRPDFIYHADMGFTRSELLRGLEKAVLPYKLVNTQTAEIEIFEANRMVKLTTGPDNFRMIASMKIPQLSVNLEFFDFDQSQFEQFMDRFKKYLHKGGG